MSRGRDHRERPAALGREAGRSDGGRDAPSRTTVPTDGLRLPRHVAREAVRCRGRTYRLRGSESETLATVGTFRVVPEAELAAGRSAKGTPRQDLQHLKGQGLVERHVVVINHRPTAVAVLTRDGKALLDAHQEARPEGHSQRYHAGLVKPRELAHDAQLSRLYQAEASRIEREGGRVTRVVLEAELKRDYQQYLNRRDRADEATLDDDRRAFAAAHELPVVDGHLALPDLRIEYETEDRRHEHRDVELVTEHYSRGQLAGKSRAGFTQYRAAGAGGWSGGSGSGGRGGAPSDPHHLERLS